MTKNQYNNVLKGQNNPARGIAPGMGILGKIVREVIGVVLNPLLRTKLTQHYFLSFWKLLFRPDEIFRFNYLFPADGCHRSP